jgi:hypothetical protein
MEVCFCDRDVICAIADMPSSTMCLQFGMLLRILLVRQRFWQPHLRRYTMLELLVASEAVESNEWPQQTARGVAGSQQMICVHASGILGRH